MKCAEKSALEDIPFDLKHYPHIIYGGSIALLKSQLEKRIRWCIENPKDSLSNVDINLNFFMNGIPLINTHPSVVKTKKLEHIEGQKC